MRGEILGVERRRFWRDEDKLEIVMSVGIDGATVTQVAQRHEITRQQVYAWRHELKNKGLWSPDAGALFYPLDIPVSAGVPAAQPAAAEVPPSNAIELRLRGGRRSAALAILSIEERGKTVIRGGSKIYSLL